MYSGDTRLFDVSGRHSCADQSHHRTERDITVGASLLAKVVNDDTGNLTPSGALGFFASKLAPTVGVGHFPQAKKSGTPTKCTAKMP
ncbi:hypothetical protein C0058_25075 [Pseudomonas sp. NC02]|nr:hypothetical protein C0058_25075 [Pseudomonas sp. NC02]